MINERPCILLVDDDEDIRKTMSLMLRKEGYEAETAATGQEALEKARERAFNLIFLDIRLPDLQGVDLIEPLKEMYPHMAVIMVTGHASVETTIQALNAGASGYIPKPVHPEEMLATVRQTLAKLRAEESLRQSEERFRQFFESIPEYGYVISPEGVILDVNSAACRALGNKKEELVGKPLKTIYAAECLPQAERLFDRWLETGQILDEEMVILSQEGERRTVLLSANAVRDREGQVLHSVSVQKDITERKRAAARLARLNRVLQAIRDINRLIVREKRAESLTKDVCRILVERRGFDAAWIALNGSGPGRQPVAVSAGLSEQAFSALEAHIREGGLPECCRQAHNVVVEVEYPLTGCAGCPLAESCAAGCVLTAPLAHAGAVGGDRRGHGRRGDRCRRRLRFDTRRRRAAG